MRTLITGLSILAWCLAVIITGWLLAAWWLSDGFTDMGDE